MALVPVARVLRAHGVRGELRVKLYNIDSRALVRGAALVVRASSGVDRSVEVRSVRPANKEVIVAFGEVTDRNLAETLHGAELLVDRASLPEAEPDSFYAFDLEGCEVIDVASGQQLGQVVGVENHGAHDLLRVAQGATEWLLPFVDAYVTEVDLESRAVHTVDTAELVALAAQSK